MNLTSFGPNPKYIYIYIYINDYNYNNINKQKIIIDYKNIIIKIILFRTPGSANNVFWRPAS